MFKKPFTTYNFHQDLFEKHQIPDVFTSIKLPFSGKTIENYNVTNTNSSNASLQLVPDYLSCKPLVGFKTKQVFQKLGFAANLSNCNTIEAYIKNHLKSNFRYKVKKSIKRAEACLEVHYKVFYGAITKEEYNALMPRFHKMLDTRFKGLNTKNLSLQNWSHYQSITYQAINQKRASLFVMYSGGAPIAFTLNFHFKNLVYFSIPTFNLDYSKFTLGNITMYKNIEWCINNNFDWYDLGYGAFDYKVSWSNATYRFKHLLVLKSKLSLGPLYANILSCKYKLINYLISKRFNVAIRHFKNSLSSKKAETFQGYEFEIIKTIDFNTAKEINYWAPEFRSLRKPILDFLYSNIENINDIRVYQLAQTNVFAVSGKKNKIKIKTVNKQ